MIFTIENLVTFFLCLAPLPSFIAFSQGSTSFLATHMGPVNPLKAAAPLFAYYLWKNRSRFDKRALHFLSVLFLAGSFSALYAGLRCGQPWLEMREWAVMVVGCIAGGCFAVLPKKKAFLTCSIWIGILLLSVVMELATPHALSWVVGHLFDSSRVNLDSHGIMGFWDIGSLGKMSMMGIWIFGRSLFRSSEQSDRTKWSIFTLLAIVSLLIVLGTTQRGPMVGFIAGAFALLALEIRRTRNWRLIGVFSLLGLISACAAWEIIPHEFLLPRIRTMFFMKDTSEYGVLSTTSINERYRINQLSYETIRDYPMGNACISLLTYEQHHLPAISNHAHSLLLQQYRTKGWIWGTLHLFLWLWSLALAFQRRTLVGSFLFAGLVSVFALGLVDHPWFVLNQATMIGTLLMNSFLVAKSPYLLD